MRNACGGVHLHVVKRRFQTSQTFCTKERGYCDSRNQSLCLAGSATPRNPRSAERNMGCLATGPPPAQEEAGRRPICECCRLDGWQN